MEMQKQKVCRKHFECFSFPTYASLTSAPDKTLNLKNLLYQQLNQVSQAGLGLNKFKSHQFIFPYKQDSQETFKSSFNFMRCYSPLKLE